MKLPTIKGFNEEAFQKYLKNTGWVMAGKVLSMVVGFIIARYLGPTSFGELSFADAFVALFAAVGTLGLDSFIVREIINEPRKRDEILGTSFWMKLSVNLFIIPIASLTYFIFRFYSSGTSESLIWLVAFCALASLFKSFNVIDSYFQSQVQSKYIVKVQNVCLLISAIVKIVLVWLQLPVIWFAIALVLDGFLLSTGLVYMYKLQKNSIKKWSFNYGRAKSLLSQSWPLILSAVMISIYMKIDQVMLKSNGSAEVGLFSAAVKVSEAWYFIPVAIVSSVFPAILSAYKTDKARYIKRLQNLYDLMVGISLPVALLISLSANTIILIFGSEYQDAGLMLKIHIWSGVFVFLGSASTQFLITEGYTVIAFIRTGAGAIINVALNLWLIPKYGGVGASIATLIAHFSATFFLLILRKTRGQGLMMLRSLFLISIISNLISLKKNN